MPTTITEEELDQMARTATEKVFKLVDVLTSWIEAKTQTERAKTFNKPLGE